MQTKGNTLYAIFEKRLIMTKSIFLNFFIFLLFINCKTKAIEDYPKYEKTFNTTEYKIKDKVYFSLKIPKSWKEIEVNGIDSDVMIFVNSLNDTITSDYGWYSNSLNDEDLPTVYTKNEYNALSENDKNNLKESEYVIIEDYNNFNYNSITKSIYKIYKIDNRKAKVVMPKASGKGITGVYFEKLYKVRGNFMNLNLYGYDVNKETEEEILNVISTIKFKK